MRMRQGFYALSLTELFPRYALCCALPAGARDFEEHAMG